MIYKVRDQSGQQHDEKHCSAHADRTLHILRNAKERADTKELSQHDIVDKDGSDNKSKDIDSHSIIKVLFYNIITAFGLQIYKFFLIWTAFMSKVLYF